MILLMLACETEEPSYGAYDPGPCGDNEVAAELSEPLVMDCGREDYGRLGYGANELLMHCPYELGGPDVVLLGDGFEELGRWDSDNSCTTYITNHLGAPQALMACTSGVYELVPGEDPALLDLDDPFLYVLHDDYDGDSLDDLMDVPTATTATVQYGGGGAATLLFPDVLWALGEGEWNGDGVVDQAWVLAQGAELAVLPGGETYDGEVDVSDDLVFAASGSYERILPAGDMDGDGYGDLLIGDGVAVNVVRGGASFEHLDDPLLRILFRRGAVEPMGFSDVDGDYVTEPIVGTDLDADYQDVYAVPYCDEGGTIQLEDGAVLVAQDVESPLEEAIPVDLDNDRKLELLVDGNYILRVYEL
ncbi:MAG: hypothetical protein GY913_03150 [Proteobacteria bacterium]|nr:hypothetical protein [Pseudomonadota bacterium]MCP4915897.1 hypothetical protein [Pseudomonadota bacterium]